MKFELLALFAVLAVVGVGLLAAIKWLRQTPARYRFFELFTALFLIVASSVALMQLPSDPVMTTRIFALLGIAAGVWNAFLVVPSFRKPRLQCSFCGKEPQHVKQLIAGPAANICNECVHICCDMV